MDNQQQDTKSAIQDLLAVASALHVTMSLGMLGLLRQIV